VNPTTLSALAVLAAYLIGAVPFAYLVARWVGGIDIRTVGSGNVGATNVGRVMGLRYFWLVFTLDLAKGLLPTWGFPRAVAALTGRPAPPDLAVLAALAAILGHNFPVYLRFKGGKGVATSLGALLALDPVASLASAAGFVVALVACRYVSVSSLFGGLVFVAVHFWRVDSAWSRGQRAMSLMTVALLVLLFVRHRKNLARIAAGTEPKVPIGKSRPKPPEDRPAGKIATAWLFALAVAGAAAAGGVTLVMRSARPPVLTVGRSTLREVAHASTGHQRAERVAFADGGRVLAVTCPRYLRLVLYRVTDAQTLEPLRDLELEGKPVAVCAAADRIYVLERPPGDDRHVKPGWWETFDFRGDPVGGRVVVGFYPDDLALSPDGRWAFVLNSGHGEGGPDRPSPSLDVYGLADGLPGSGPVGRVTFDSQGDDPSRLTLSASGRCAAVTLSGSNAVASVDLDDPTHPLLIGRAPLPAVERPYLSRTLDDRIVMPVESGSEGVVLTFAGRGECVACTLPRGSALELVQSSAGRSLGTLTLRTGAFGLSATRPIALAYSPERHLIAVVNRSGGVHLVAVRTSSDRVAGERSGRPVR
jgi:glycerol-3-phosphate acyltransferase PlsY